MANNMLKAIITADGSQFTKSLKTLETQLKSFQEGLKNATNVESFNRLNRAIDATKQRIESLKSFGTQLEQVAKSTRNSTQSVVNFGRVLQDLPYGIQGVANNIDPLVASLGGPAGLGVIVAASTTAIILFKKQIEDLFSVTKSARTTTLDEAFKLDSVSDAAATVKELSINVDLAKQGFLNKKDVLKQYNETLGESIGRANSLDEAEQLLVKNGKAYIDMTLLKAAANLALNKAADLAIQLAQDQSKQTDIDILKNKDKFDQTVKQSAKYKQLAEEFRKATYNPNPKVAAKAGQVLDEFYNSQIVFLSGGTKAKNKKELEDIATQFQKDAANIAKQFNIDFFGFKDKDDKKDKIIDETINKAKAYAAELKKIGLIVPDFTVFDTKAEQYKKALQLLKDFQNASLKFNALPIEIPTEIPSETVATSTTNYNRFGAILGQEFVDGFREAAGPTDFTLIDAVAEEKKLKGLQQGFIKIGEGIGQFVTPAIDAMVNAIGEGKNAFQAFGQAVGQILLGVIKKLIQAAVLALIISAISGGSANAAKGGLSFAQAFKGAFGGFRAGGGPVAAGTGYVVGENGPEYFVPNTGGTIIPNGGGGSFAGAMGNGMGKVVFEIQGNKLVGVLANASRSQARLS